MKLRLTLASTLLLFSLSVSAQFQTLQLAHEVPVDMFVVPVTSNGNLNFRSCEECEMFTARLTPQTQYLVDGKPVDLQRFRAAVLSIRNRSGRYLTLLQHLESNTITSIEVQI